MPTLFHILNLGNESLKNSRMGVDVTGHNIANANTEGYSRQSLNVQQKDPFLVGTRIFGDGARVQSIERAHDEFIESQLIKEHQVFGEKETLSAGLAKLENLFNPELTSTIRDRFTHFNNALRNLSNYPEENATRTHMIESAKSLAQSFNVTHKDVTKIQNDMTDQINGELGSLNQKLTEIAQLNKSIREMETNPQKANDLRDQRDKVLKAASEIIDLNSYIDSNDQVVVRGPNDNLLIEGSHAAQLFLSDTARTRSAQPHVMVTDIFGGNPKDINDSIFQGKISGLISVRDTHCQQALDDINLVAKTYADEFNALHRRAFGSGEYSASNGRDFFMGVDHPDGQHALKLDVNPLVENDITALSIAISPDSTGDNVFCNLMTKLTSEPLLENGTMSVLGLYDRMAGRIGINSMQAIEAKEASNIVLSRLKAQRESVAGVSLDEEAANLLKYQHLFTASSRVITTADQMFQTVLDLKR